MQFLTRWFRRSQEEDYETVLQNLALSIQRRQSQLSEIRVRERRATLLVTVYALAAWLIYVGLWYLGFLSERRAYSRGVGNTRKALKVAPLFVGPIIILFTRRIVQVWYTRKGNHEEKSLRLLLKEQRSKVEEIKKKTNYYSTRNLIERYDEVEASPIRRRAVVSPISQTPPPSSMASTSTTFPRPVPVSQPPPVQPQQKAPLGPSRKQWYDKLADAVLGADDEVVPGANKFALICEKCFAHNGLMEPDRWLDVQYICPKCNHFNASARSKHEPLSQSHDRHHDRDVSSQPSSPLSPVGKFAAGDSRRTPPPSSLRQVDHAESERSCVKSETPGSGEMSMMEVDN